jgi:hypothetical protein
MNWNMCYLNMYFNVLSRDYFNRIQATNSAIMGGPKRFIELDETQRTHANDFTRKLGDTCEKCKNLGTFASTINPKDAVIERALPGDTALSFDKKELLENSVKEMKQIHTHFANFGFIPSPSYAYLGRMLSCLRTTIDGDISDASISPCRQSIDQTMSSLETFCAALPVEKNDLSVVWIKHNTFATDQWKLRNLNQSEEL